MTAEVVIRNNITRSLNIFGINRIDVSYCLLSNISALLSKSHFQSEPYSLVHKKLNIQKQLRSYCRKVPHTLNLIYTIKFDNCSGNVQAEDFHGPEKPLEKTREINNEARISKEAEMKRKFNRNQKHLRLRETFSSNILIQT